MDTIQHSWDARRHVQLEGCIETPSDQFLVFEGQYVDSKQCSHVSTQVSSQTTSHTMASGVSVSNLPTRLLQGAS